MLNKNNVDKSQPFKSTWIFVPSVYEKERAEVKVVRTFLGFYIDVNWCKNEFHFFHFVTKSIDIKKNATNKKPSYLLDAKFFIVFCNVDPTIRYHDVTNLVFYFRVSLRIYLFDILFFVHSHPLRYINMLATTDITKTKTKHLNLVFTCFNYKNIYKNSKIKISIIILDVLKVYSKGKGQSCFHHSKGKSGWNWPSFILVRYKRYIFNVSVREFWSFQL